MDIKKQMGRFFFFLFIGATALYGVSSFAQTQIISHWDFNEGVGVTATDKTGNNNGTINGAQYITGKYGTGLNFDGVDDSVQLGNFDVSGSALTLTAWVRADRFNHYTAHDARIISKSTGTAERDHYFMLSTIKVGTETFPRFRLKTNNQTITLIPSSGALAINTWVHVAAVYDGAQMKLYKDGQLIGSVNKTGTLSTNSQVPVWIGRNPNGYGTWDGVIDDVRIYGEALTQTQIQNIMNDAGGTTPPPTDTTAPTIALTTPTNGATLSGTATLSATASDASGIANIQFRIDNTTFATDPSTPYTATLDTTAYTNGTHTLTAIAQDAAGNTSSQSVTVTINNVTVPPTGGSYPENNPNAWGHLHPTCPDEAVIEATSCGNSASAGASVQNCSIKGGFTFGGSNITMSCVKWDLNGGTRGAFCSGTCQNINIQKTTMTGSGPGTDSTFLNLSSSYGSAGAKHTMRVEKSVIQGNRVGVILGGGKFMKDSATIEPGFAFIARENIFRDPLWAPSAHSEHIAFIETMDGALIENNVFDCQNSHNGGNACNTAQLLGQPSNGANIQNLTIRGNRFIGDTASVNGYEFTINHNPSNPGNPSCAYPILFNDNVIEQYTTVGIFNTSGCDSIGSRPGSSCTGNTVNGAPLNCGGSTSTPPPATDTTAPTIALTTPTNGQTLSGTQTLSATASDSSGIANVQFRIDNTTFATDPSTPYTATLDTTAYTNGTHTLTAIAQDAAGNTSSQSVTVTINNVTSVPPSTKFTQGDMVQVTSGTVNVRQTPNSTIVGTQTTGSVGSVTSGPTTTGGYTWWQVNFDTGADGWMAEEFLEKVSNTETGGTGGESSSTNLPVTQTLSLHLTADSDITTSGTGVSSWNDQSGNGRHAIQNNSASQPTLVTSAINGKPVLRFDGTNDYLSFNLLLNNLSQATFIIVSKANQNYTGGSTNAANAVLYWKETAGWGATYFSPFQTNIKWRFGTTQTGNLPSYTRPITQNGFSISTVIKNGSTETLYVDGTQVAQASGKLNTLIQNGTVATIARGYSDNTYFSGDIAEIIIYTRALSESELAQLHNYLNTKYFGSPPPPTDITAPTISLTTPTNGQTISGTQTITATASDSSGVANIQFRINNQTLTIDSTSPYTTTLNTTSYTNGTYTITAIAQDAAGNTSSQSIAVTINNQTTTGSGGSSSGGTSGGGGGSSSSSGGGSSGGGSTSSGGSSSSTDGSSSSGGSGTSSGTTGSGGTNTTTTNTQTRPEGIYITAIAQVTANRLNVRDGANGTKLGTQTTGASGTVTGGPLTAGGYTWWYVDFTTGTDGWVAGEYLTNPVTKSPGTTTQTTTRFTRSLTLGSRGEDVKRLQQILNQNPATQIANTGAGSPGNETEYFGGLTKDAVIRYQLLYKNEILTPVGLTRGTGYVGPSTLRKLNGG